MYSWSRPVDCVSKQTLAFYGYPYSLAGLSSTDHTCESNIRWMQKTPREASAAQRTCSTAYVRAINRKPRVYWCNASRSSSVVHCFGWLCWTGFLRISEVLSMKINHIQIMPEGMSIFLPT